MTGTSYIRLYDRTHIRLANENFPHTSFAAAVAFACGRGFVDLGESLTPGLDAFLQVRSDRFSCAELSAVVPATSPDFTQGLYRYLMLSVGGVWRFRGVISWSGLWPLFGILYGCAVAASYGVFRAMVKPGWAIAASSALLVSPIHLTYLPYLRDYAKAPFMIGAIALLLHLSAAEISPRRMLVLAGAFGLLLGVGFGFRNDIGISVPPFIAVVLLARPRLPITRTPERPGLRHSTAMRRLLLAAGALTIATVVFVIAAFPVLTSYSRGSNSGHVALLGLMSPFDHNLGIRPAPYDWGYVDDDSFAEMVIADYRTRVAGHADATYSRDYDRALMKYLLLIARHWPADMIVRAFAAVIKVLNMPFSISDFALATPMEIHQPLLLKFYDWRVWFLSYLTGRGGLIVALALIVLSLESVPAALGVLLLVIYYSGYPAIQFHPRHFFHLEFLGLGALAYVAAHVVDAAHKAILRLQEFRSVEAWLAAFGRVVAFAAASVAILVASVTVARAYQEWHVRSIVRTYLDAPRTRIDTAVVPADEHTFFRVRRPEALPAGRLSGEYFIAAFSPEACQAIYLPDVQFTYANVTGRSILSRTRPVRLVPGAEPTYVFFPAYSTWPSSYFDGIELPRANERCLTAVYRISDLTSVPLLLGLTIEPGWERSRFAQTIESIERNDSDRRLLPRIVVDPPDLVVPRGALDEPLVDISADVLRQSRLVSRSAPGRWTIGGRPDLPTSELLTLKNRDLPHRTLFVAQGDLRRGGVSFTAFDQHHRVAARAVVSELGSFLVTMAVPAEGAYSLEVNAHAAPWFPASWIGHRVGPLVGWIPFATMREDLTLHRMGWLDAVTH